ncbi:MAG TPA: branched-chain amino acid ABC transporter permease [Solirubrobacteraceae bacterium]|nr:branched-chain amino acid ABC transporter permease [Solirubrobacteraceae bacterium]
MTGGPEVPPVQRPPEEVRPSIGKDEWVASVAGRRQGRGGLLGTLHGRVAATPAPRFFAAFAVLAALLPLVTRDEYVIRVGFDTLLYMLLALGLNLVVGWAGLLDLGYVAFYGLGAYTYAVVASPKFGLHWPTPAAMVLAVVVTAAVGFLVALPSRRLVGDYLAIVTLFFGQLFVTVVNNGNRLSFLGLTQSYDVTGGPNGIADIDPFHAFGHDLIAVEGYYWLALATFVLVLTAVYLVDRSRTGRAWRSLREDPLAAELMGMPINRLKLVAFACGAAIAGLTGTLFSALNTAVFASNFDVPLLITIYAMVILGGAGSLGGVILGAVFINVTLELLRSPDNATWVFFLLVALTLASVLRPWRRLATVLGATVVLGFAVRAIVSQVWPSGVDGQSPVGGTIGTVLEHWVVLPGTHQERIGNWAFVALIVVVLFLTTLRGLWRDVLLVPTVYLAAFVWENRLAVEPSVTRLILIGVILIVVMNARPEGILGTSRVEIV